MRWLVVSPYLPHPEIGHGGGTAVRQLCEELARHHETTLLCFQREGEAGRERWLRERGVDVVTLPWSSDQDRGLARLGLLLDRARVLLAQQRHDRPWMVEKYDRPELARALDQVLEEKRCEVVQVEYSFLSPAAARARRHPSAPAVLLNTHEIASLPRSRELDRATNPLARLRARQALRRAENHERTLSAAADRVLCVTDQDRERLAASTGVREGLVTVPLGFATADLPPAHSAAADPPRLLFVGSFTHPPNAAGARILVEEILPLVHAIRPDVELDVVGRGAGAALGEAAAASGGRVRVHGFVPELDPWFAQCSLFVAPLYSGGGIKIKVLEAMARSACIVSTPIGAEGIDDEGEALSIASSPSDFAAAILDLLGDPARREERSQRARALLEERFAWPSIVGRLTELAAAVIAERTQSPGRQSGSDRVEP